MREKKSVQGRTLLLRREAHEDRTRKAQRKKVKRVSLLRIKSEGNRRKKAFQHAGRRILATGANNESKQKEFVTRA